MEEGVKAKRGYSIWSLLVIMTLMAMWMAIPKPTWKFGPIYHTLFVGCHQVAIWTLVGVLVWLLTGKRRIVLLVEASTILLIWGPLFVALLEYFTFEDETVPYTRSVLEPLGLYEAYIIY